MTEPEDPVDLEALLHAAVREILRHEDPQRWHAWMREHLGDFVDSDAGALMPPEGWQALAGALARAVWNATPLPGNRFRPAPLPAPGRNDPCPCGSGRKFKRCCARAPAGPAIDPDLVWSFALDALSREQFAQALALKQVPISSLAFHAEDLLREGDSERASSLLAPVFEGSLAALRSEAHALALDVYLIALDELDREDEKRALLDRVIGEVPRSPLRAGAWQRLATIRMDEDDSAGAWDAFRRAQRDQPDAPALAQLEIVLLGADDREDEIPDRARYWMRRLGRQGFGPGDDLVDWLEAAEHDPGGALAALGMIGSGGDAGALRDWLGEVRERPIPRYALCDRLPDAPEDEADALAAHLRAMGVSRDQVGGMVEEILRDRADSPGDADGEPEDDDGAPLDPPDSRVLAGPEGLREIERDWHEVFPGDKPISVHDHLQTDDSAWETAPEWVGFLADHPQAFDSLDILDDLAAAVLAHPMCGDPSFDDLMLVPLLERATAIVDRALDGVPEARLAWVMAANRPALRALVRLANLAQEVDDFARAIPLAERLVSLNPHDNHGFRAFLMDEYVLAGNDEEAAALAEGYPGDMLAETIYGRALALYRLGRTEAADEAVAAAAARLPKVRDFLVGKRVRPPEMDDSGHVSIGGADQAWAYREIMLPVWKATPGALEWLANVKAPKRGRGSKRRPPPPRAR